MQFTEITLTVGQTHIPATLNGGRAAKDLISMLPYTVQLHKYVHDYCGVMGKALEYAPEDLGNGWKNGDISFAADGNYFAILYKDEEISAQYGNLVNLGKISVDPSIMDTLDDAISVRIELKD
ncbi:hypothetical protein JWJ90_20065 [Desulfobulbus rhabdoformis]|uniref:cyclophilin-like fold protein n=1 Tax=Desulfobulbus rhabdoformis TaxID=34032 RepID=UPI0019658DA2|nr:cyclophilin-like fold protein [Desulfobulbus rhabdoformis]MBM9616566.1 hypothetical protein [Desulfobulbus rhabdoformis]